MLELVDHDLHIRSRLLFRLDVLNQSAQLGVERFERPALSLKMTLSLAMLGLSAEL